MLDVPCGQGRHAHLLAEAGFDVDGLDYSTHLLARARERGTGPTLRYTRGDMRALPARWTGRFDAVRQPVHVVRLLHRSRATTRASIAEFARVLKPGGMLVWHGGSRDGVMARFLARDWWKSRRRHDDRPRAVASIRCPACSRSTPTWEGPSRTRAARSTASASTRRRDLAELCLDAGLVVEEAYDGWHDRPLRRRSGEMLLVARKRELPRRRRGG